MRNSNHRYRPLWNIACLLLMAVASHGQTQDTPPYLIGRGLADITGPAYGVQLWGFSRADQIGEGLHIRQRSRAFIVAQSDQPAQRLVFVSADIGSIDHPITLQVIETLQQRYGNTYTLNNVILSATHTHAGPGGYWHSRTDTGLDGGLYREHFDAIVNGIVASIVQAHEDLQPGNIFINTGEVSDAGVNRSAIAYAANPAAERARYAHNTNKRMTLLKFVDDSGAIGMINWYALHPTAMNFYNLLVSGDHKGYASLAMERQQGTRYPPEANDTGFVAAFAQSDPGDVTPNTNLDNTGPGETDVATTQIMGQRQLQVARALFDSATERLQGPVQSLHAYTNLNGYNVDGAFTGQGPQTTCPSAYGYSFAAGSTEDGGAHFLFEEGMTEQKVWLDWLIRAVTGAPKWTEAVRACQAPKAILFETGSQQPPMQSQIRSVSVARIGQLVILAMPGEVNTMAGRRLRESVMNALGDWARHIVLAGYANDYAGYVTTPEEYQLQQYEAAHNLHGQWSLPAYQQIASGLARAMDSGQRLTNDTAYDDWRGKSTEKSLPVTGSVQPPGGMRFGQPQPLARSDFARGDTVTATFWSSNPVAHYVTGNNFLRVERNVGKQWALVATDTDWQTRIRWQSRGDHFIARVQWDIPADAAQGSYRIVHSGFDPTGVSFSGTSDTFRVGQ
jgi:neutral ceramidase